MIQKTRAGRRIVVGALLAVALLVAMAAPAPGIPPAPITCTAAGTLNTVDGGPIDGWTVSGKGSCLADRQGPYLVTFTGVGTSQGLGLCDGSVIVRDFNIVITGLLKNTVTGKTKPLSEEWFSLVTTYPIVTPFLVATDDGKLGAGLLSTRIGGNCNGSPAATFVWTQLT